MKFLKHLLKFIFALILIDIAVTVLTALGIMHAVMIAFLLWIVWEAVA